MLKKRRDYTDELEKQNNKLRGMLSDAISICDAAIADDKMWRKEVEQSKAQSPPTEPSRLRPEAGDVKLGKDDLVIALFRQPGFMPI